MNKIEFKKFLIKIKDKILDIFYPNDIKCIFCNNEIPSGYICDDCYKLHLFNEGNRCQKCDSPIKEGNIICDHCKRNKRVYERCFCPLNYDGNVRKSLLKFKSDSAKYLAKPFAEFIAQKLEIEEVDFDVIVPVPSHKKTVKARGYNPAKVLADELSVLTGKPVADVLYKTFNTKKQKNLNFQERQSNLENSITILDKSAINGKNVLIVDDIITTTATIDTCARVMTKAKTIYGCAVARRALKN